MDDRSRSSKFGNDVQINEVLTPSNEYPVGLLRDADSPSLPQRRPSLPPSLSVFYCLCVSPSRLIVFLFNWRDTNHLAITQGSAPEGGYLDGVVTVRDLDRQFCYFMEPLIWTVSRA